jgi:hypothetical protein
MASHIERRKFLATLGGAAAWPLAARAQQPDRMRLIGVLMAYADSDSTAQSWLAAFRICDRCARRTLAFHHPAPPHQVRDALAQ